jgi:ATP phosphoribosyltransferase
MNPARPLEEDAPLRLALPKGRMQKQVLSLMDAAGLHVDLSERTLRPRVAAEWLSPKLLKPQNIVTMLHEGSRELGFTGADWVREAGGELIELLDTGLDPVRIVVAAPTELLENGELPQRPLVIASELERITTDFIAERGMGDRFVRTYGATEVFPPEDADVIVDVVQTGSTLVANGLVEVQTLMRSSTRLWAHPGAYADAARRAWIDRYVLLISSVLEGAQARHGGVQRHRGCSRRARGRPAVHAAADGLPAALRGGLCDPDRGASPRAARAPARDQGTRRHGPRRDAARSDHSLTGRGRAGSWI